VLHYAVPLFVFISGALVWARPWRGGPGAYRQFLARRAGVIGLPYLAWAGLYAALSVSGTADAATPLHRLPGLIATGHIWYHLYFVPMLLTFYLLTPLASRFARWSPEGLLAVTYALRIVAGPSLTHAAASVDPLFGQYATHVLSHLPHMALGAWFALRLPVLPGWFRSAWPVMLVAGLSGLTVVSAQGLPDWPLELQRLLFPAAMAATVLGMALGALALEPRYESRASLLTRLGSLAFGVYFVHPIFLELVGGGVALSGSWPWAHWWFAAGVWLVVSAASFGASELFARNRATAWLVGLHPTRR
jgi:surface polysaccharide O-acyltransferase-like enzyme